MSRPPALDQAKRVADAVSEAIEGNRMASHFLARLRCEYPDVDDLYRLILTAQQSSPDRLVGLLRRLQKELEASRYAS